jgi:uncharacterized membrane protein
MSETTLADPERTRHRLEILNQAFKGLLIIHGGGAVALLAFLQALGNQNPELSKVILVGMAFLVIGLVLNVLFMTFRYHTSLEDQGRNPNWRKWRAWAFRFLYSSVACFVFAMGVLIVGAFLLLP